MLYRIQKIIIDDENKYRRFQSGWKNLGHWNNALKVLISQRANHSNLLIKNDEEDDEMNNELKDEVDENVDQKINNERYDNEPYIKNEFSQNILLCRCDFYLGRKGNDCFINLN